MHHARALIVNDGDQTRTQGKHSLLLVVWPPVRIEPRDASFCCIKVKSKNFGELLDTKWPNGNREAVKETTSVPSVVLLDILQYTFVSPIQRLGQLVENRPNIWLDYVPQRLELTEYPLEPVQQGLEIYR